MLHLSKFVQSIIASYAVTDYNCKKLNRRASGWVNDYSRKELEEVFKKAGFYCNRVEMWDSQLIFRFIKNNATY